MFNPIISQWFAAQFQNPTPVQVDAWQKIATGKDVLLAAPTGSGKTLAAFLSAINQLYESHADSTTGLKVIYISPLKALSNDININLQQPLAGINQLQAMDAHITSAVWTGDTPSYNREKIKRQPPHILVTTPESLYNILTSKAGRAIMSGVETVIVDEVHALASNKRGAHLLLTLMRLEALTYKRPQRIGVSATQRPIERMQHYLLHPEFSVVVDKGHKRLMDLSIQLPASPLAAVISNEQWAEVYSLLARAIKQHKTTVVFVNNRRLAERVAKHLAEKVTDGSTTEADTVSVTAHHGSLAKAHRLKAEQDLKAGKLKAIVATASLELGIDIGEVDLVCQLGSPGSIQAFLQRVGRSGHGVNRTPKGMIYPLTIDDLLEATALFRAIEDDRLELIEFPQQPLDVLAQQIVAEVAQQNWPAKRLYHLFKQASVYADLTEQAFYQVVNMLAEGYSGRSSLQKALVFYDETTDEIRPRKAAALTALLNGGTIPEHFDYDVRLLPEDLQIGTLNEDFSFDSVPGDVFQLGNHSYRILKVQTGTVFVEDAAGQPPNIPFWFGVQMWRSDELSTAVSQLRHDFEVYLQDSKSALELPVEQPGVEQLINYVSKTKDVLGVVPSQKDIVVERFFDGNNDMHLVIHSVFGSRVNRAWGLALRKKFCRQFNFELQAAALEDALILSLSSTHSFELSIIASYLSADTVKEVLIQALLDTPFFVTQWRWNASVALAVKRRRGGKKVIPQFQRNEAEDLVAEIFPDQIACAENIAGNRTVPDHPLVTQTIIDCTEGIMDVNHLAEILRDIANNKVNIHYIDSHTPSPTSLAIINARNYAFLDEAPAEERRTLAVHSQSLDESFAAFNLSTSDIETFNLQLKPKVRDSDELHEWVFFHGVVWPDEAAPYNESLQQLLTAERLHAATYKDQTVLFSPKYASLLQRLIEQPEQLSPDDLLTWVSNRLALSGLVTFKALHQRIPVAASLLLQALLQLEVQGVAFRFSAEQWIERNHLAQLRRSQLQRARRSVNTLSTESYTDFLSEWQFLTTPAVGVEGLSQVLQQWQGYAAHAMAWEAEVLKPRVRDYHGMMLDMLCQSGQFIWKRAKAKLVADDLNQMTIQKTQFTFLQRDWRHLFPAVINIDQLNFKSRSVVRVFETHGALFFRELLTFTELMPVELEQVLIHLIKQGLIVADGFQALRVFSQSPAERRRQLLKAKKYANNLGYLEMMGRWSLIAQKPADIKPYINMMLNRYGVLSYDIWNKEDMPFKWRAVSMALQTMEARGEVLAGRFIDNMSGMQYARHTAAKRIQAMGVVKSG